MLDGKWQECGDEWAEIIKDYWFFIGGGDLLVFYDSGWDDNLLTITNVCSDEGRDGCDCRLALFCGRVLSLPEDRNYLWHELGHVYTSEHGMSRVMREYLADMWAVTNAVIRGMYDVAREIVDRCLNFLCTRYEGDCYYCSGKRIVYEFGYLI